MADKKLLASEYTYITYETPHGTIIIFCNVQTFQSVLQYWNKLNMMCDLTAEIQLKVW